MGDEAVQEGSQPPYLQPGTASGPIMISGAPAMTGYLQGQASADYTNAVQVAQHQYPDSQQAFSSQLEMTHPQTTARQGLYNLAAMGNALPQAVYRPNQYEQGQQRYSQPAVPSGVSMTPQVAQYGPTQQYYISHHAPVPQYYPAPMSPSQVQNGLPPRANMAYYPNSMVMGQQPAPNTQYYYAQHGQYAGQPPNLLAQGMPGHYVAATGLHGDGRIVSSQPGEHPQAMALPTSSVQSRSGGEDHQNIVRGPPRKPRQSGHAIWIGNLPPQTDLMNLVHHVCKQAAGLESLFLISKSNCAFANFKDEPSCVAAQQKLHDSRFQSVRLVSRLRKSTVEGATGMAAPTGPSAAQAGQTQGAGEQEKPSQGKEDGASHPAKSAVSVEEKAARFSPPDEALPQDKFFVLKSLTVEDLELSVRTGIWATQSHNEEILNKAFAAADNVYLIFSANKSGEYFGYARMTSPINEDPDAAIEFAPSAQTTNDPDLPKAIPTEATGDAPRGRIIDDSARGTIFWEAERDDGASDGGGEDGEGGSGVGSVAGDTNSVKSGGHDGLGGESKAWGKPFRLEWVSTTRLPFYRTRGLRNPWNSNREVKIARDGTELEPVMARRLIGLFHRDLSQAAALAPGGPGGVGLGGPMMIAGYPPMQSNYRQP